MSRDPTRQRGNPARRGEDGISCVIADDHPAVLEAVRAFLTSKGIKVAARARDGAEALAEIKARKPDVALIDLAMPQMSGVEATREVSRRVPETSVILYTGRAERAQLTEALDAGARGFVLKEAPLDDLLRAIEIVSRGGVYVDPVLAGVIATAESVTQSPKLTHREREVLRLLAAGLRTAEIGKRLFISPETVRSHARKATARLEADTRTQAVAEAIRQELIA